MGVLCSGYRAEAMVPLETALEHNFLSPTKKQGG